MQFGYKTRANLQTCDIEFATNQRSLSPSACEDDGHGAHYCSPASGIRELPYFATAIRLYRPSLLQHMRPRTANTFDQTTAALRWAHYNYLLYLNLLSEPLNMFCYSDLQKAILPAVMVALSHDSMTTERKAQAGKEGELILLP